MPLPLLIGAGLALGGAIGKFASGVKQSKEAKKINPQWQDYQTSPFATRRLGLANQLFNSRMAGAAQMERNLLSSQGNVLDAVQRNATDSSQALAFAAGSQGQTDQSLSDLQTAEQQNKYSMLDNLNNAYETMIGEGDKVYGSQLQKFQIDSQRKDALASSGAANKYGAIGDLGSMFMMGDQLFGGGGGNSRSRMRPTVTTAPQGTPGVMTQPNLAVGRLPTPRSTPTATFPRAWTPYLPPPRNFNYTGG